MPTRTLEEVGDFLGIVEGPARYRAVLLLCPSCGSVHVAQVLGDNGGISYVCTACGHSWS
jgi:predicted RNA-binding Zn-ribbon protein involved in translation (DUF1610 family)